MEDDNYDILPHREIVNLKKELQNLKQGKSNEFSETFEHSVGHLTRLLNEILRLLREASEGMKLEEEEEIMVSKKIRPLEDKLETIIDQNNKIAEGLIAVADMMKDKGSSVDMPRFKKPNLDANFPPPPSQTMSNNQFTSPPPPSPINQPPNFGAPPPRGSPPLQMNQGPPRQGNVPPPIPPPQDFQKSLMSEPPKQEKKGFLSKLMKK